MSMRLVAAVGLAFASAGCMTNAASGPAGASASADLMDATGVRKAAATVREDNGGLRLEIRTEGLAPGTYAAHIHTVGRCEAPGFQTAGGHWNPTSRQHGHDNPAGAHMGDLPNIVVDAQGRGQIDATVANAQLSGGANPLLDADGAAVVIHARADDYRSDPAGNAGDRIACGVLQRAG